VMNLDREQFRAWLLSQAAGAEVGKVEDGCSCPMARWIAEMVGQKVEVSGIGWWLEDGVLQALPWWAVGFVFWVDGDAECIRRGAVTRERALLALSQCC
jgi:hypothetical protein